MSPDAAEEVVESSVSFDSIIVRTRFGSLDSLSAASNFQSTSRSGDMHLIQHLHDFGWDVGKLVGEK